MKKGKNNTVLHKELNLGLFNNTVNVFFLFNNLTGIFKPEELLFLWF